MLHNLPVGPYRFEASLQGFRTYAQTGIVLEVGANPTRHVTLELGQIEETVSVQGNAALVETRNPGIGQVITNEQVLELPLNGRQLTRVDLPGRASPPAVPTPMTRPGASALNSGVRSYPNRHDLPWPAACRTA